PRLRLRSSNRPFELFCGLVNAKRCRVQAIAITFQRFFLHESDDFRLVTLREQRFQVSLQFTYVSHSGDVLAVTPQRSTPALRGASLCLWHTVGSQVRSILRMPSFRHAVGIRGM